jgi:hypothetical protein
MRRRSSWHSQSVSLALSIGLVGVTACGDDAPSAAPGPPSASDGGGDTLPERGDDAVGPSFDSIGPSIDMAAGPPCNAWPALCDRPYDQVVFPATHASITFGQNWKYPAQKKGIRAQLDESIRALMFEVHDLGGDLVACSQDCAEGHVLFRAGLDDVRAFLDDNPRQVLTLFIDNRVPAARVASAFDDAKLASLLHPQSPAAPWPTLGDLIARGERVVVFVDESAGAPATLLPFDGFAWKTGANFHVAGEMNCDAVRGDRHDPLMLVPHVLTEPRPVQAADASDAGPTGDGDASVPEVPGFPSETLAQQVNRNPFLLERLAACRAQQNRLPTFVAVDFYDTSDVVSATQKLSGLVP